MTAVAAAAALPARLGKFEIMMPLAAGGMARIYIGRTTGIGSFERHVVLKLILPERANDHVAVQMFLDEARLSASLNHQNVAQVFEVGEDGGIHYLAMEYVHGQDLRALLAKAGAQGMRVPLELALTIVSGAAAGLHHAHERRGPDGISLGIVHRDVSPSNIMIGYDGAVKLLDFGIAKATARSVETQSGIIKGKFAYMAPEQCRGRDVDRRSDVFSLGIILYEVTTQHRCFRAESDFDTMHRIVTGDVVRPSRLVSNYPPPLEAIVMKALSVDPAARYQSAGLLLEALEQFAIDTRMSLSQMALGRFMRETFGELPEPWLSGKHTAPTMPPRESTISNTDSHEKASRIAGASSTLPTEPLKVPRVDVHGRPLEPPASGRRDESGPVPGPPGPRTLLDLPRGHGEAAEEGMSEEDWNAKSYPTMQPAYASASTLGPEAGRTPSGPLPRELAGNLMAGIPGVPLAAPSVGSGGNGGNGGALAGTGSNAAIPIPSTRHGYASAPGTTRADSNMGTTPFPMQSSQGQAYRVAGPAAVAAQPARKKTLVVGIACGVFGVVVLIAVVFAGGSSNANETGIEQHPAAGSATVAMPAVDHGEAAPAAIGSAVHDDPAGPPPAGSAGSTTSGSALVRTPPGTSGAVVAAGSAAADQTHPAEHPADHLSATGSDAGSAAVATSPHAGSAAPPAEPMTAVAIDSDPEGAEVVLGGKRLGVTPLSVHVKRAGTATLVLRRAHYSEQTLKVDLATDVTRAVTLKKLEVTTTSKPSSGTTATRPTHKVDCQPRSAVNPFDSRPVCKT